MRRPREVVCTLPSDAHSICAPWLGVRNLIGALAVGANRPCLPCLCSSSSQAGKTDRISNQLQ